MIEHIVKNMHHMHHMHKYYTLMLIQELFEYQLKLT